MVQPLRLTIDVIVNEGADFAGDYLTPTADEYVRQTYPNMIRCTLCADADYIRPAKYWCSWTFIWSDGKESAATANACIKHVADVCENFRDMG